MAPDNTCVRCGTEVELINQACSDCHDDYFGDGVREFVLTNGEDPRYMDEAPARGVVLPSYRAVVEESETDAIQMFADLESLLSAYTGYEIIFA